LKHYQFNDDLASKALEAFGIKNQLRQLQEELCEASLEIGYFFRNRPYKLVEEMADVLIVLNQLEHHLGSEFIQRAIERKEQKLKGYLDYRDRKNG
jgi:hypothetical protein